jgi:hypothetical protein
LSIKSARPSIGVFFASEVGNKVFEA